MSKLSPSAVVDGVYDTLISASEFAASEVSKNDYTILTRAPGSCALIVRFRATVSEPLAYGNPRSQSLTTTVEISGYTRETGDSTQALGQQLALIDKVVNVIHSTNNLGGAVKVSRLTEIEAPPGFVLNISGFRWLPVTFRVKGEQF